MPNQFSIRASTLWVLGFSWLGLLSCVPQTQADRLHLQPCADARLTDALCGTLTVAEDPAVPEGRQLDLKLIVLRALEVGEAAEAKAAPLFYLAGGPGAAATDYVGQWNESPLRRARDLVFVDQRGTGGSNPLQCPLLGLQATLDFVLFARLPDAAACAERLSESADLRRYTTRYAADDLDAVRVALGYARIDLLGVSYGTHTAQVYLQRYPQHVRSLVLRGVITPRQNLSLQLDGTLAALDALFADCRADAGCSALVPDPEMALGIVRDRLRAEPAYLTVTDTRTGQPARVEIREEHVLEIVRLWLYDARASSYLPAALAAAAAGDLQPLVQRGADMVATVVPRFATGLLLAVSCAEGEPYLPSVEDVRASVGDRPSALALRIEELRRSCVGWPHAEGDAELVQSELVQSELVVVDSDVPALLVSGALDPATPPSGAAAVLAHLPNSRHLVLPAVAHSPLAPGCVEDLILTFFEDAGFDRLDTSCLDDLRRPPFHLPASTAP